MRPSICDACKHNISPGHCKLLGKTYDRGAVDCGLYEAKEEILKYRVLPLKS